MRTILLALLVLGAAQCAYPTDSFVLHPRPADDTGLAPDDADTDADAATVDEDVPVATDQGTDAAFDLAAEPGLDAPADLPALDRPADLPVDLASPDRPVDVPVDRPADVVCPSGQTNCAGVCRNLLSDPLACGTCRTSCLVPANARASCVSGTCNWTCLATWGDCNHLSSDGCERELTDELNCGSCGRHCSGGTICDCTIDRCRCTLPF